MMRCNLIQKRIALLMALILLFGCVSALAEGTVETAAESIDETEAAPAIDRSAFFGNLLDKFGTVDLNTRQLRLTVPPEIVYGGLTVSLQAQDGLGSLLLSSDGAPVAELQSDGRTVWLSAGGSAYSLSLTDLREIAQNILGVFWLDDRGRENLGAFLSQNLVKLYQYTLADGVMAMQGMDGSTMIQLNLNGTRIMNGLASFLEDLANSPDLSGALGMREGSAKLLAALLARITGNVYDSAFADAQIRDLLRQAAEWLRKLRPDVNLFATISLTLGREAAVRVRATLVVGGQTYNLDADYTGSGGSGTASLSFYDARIRYVSALLDWKQQGGTTQFELNADVGTLNLNVTGAASRDSLRAEVRVTSDSGSWMPFNASVTALRTKKTSILNVISNYGSLDVYLTASEASIALRGNAGAAIDLVLRKENEGFPLAHLNVAGIGYPGYLFVVDWDGRTLTVGNPEAKTVITGREISATQYAVDLTFARHIYGYYNYYSNEWYEPSDSTDKATLLFTLTEGGGLLGLGSSDGWALTASLQSNGTIRTLGTLECTDQRSQQPLSGSPATQITWDFLLENLMNLLSQISYRSAPATEYRIEERVTEAVEAIEAPAEVPEAEAVEAVEEAMPVVENLVENK